MRLIPRLAVTLAAVLLAAPAMAKVIVLDCYFPQSPTDVHQLISMDTDAQTVSATAGKWTHSTKLFTDGSYYWFTVPFQDSRLLEEYRINRTTLRFTDTTNGPGVAPAVYEGGLCEIVQTPAPKI